VGPLIIEKGTDVTLDIFALHFDRKIWGKDVDEYRPERWLETDTLHSSFYSFGAGPRICLGMRLAFLEQQMMLTYLLRKYRIVESNEMVGLFMG
jgi:cytochrome P450 family 13